jgi:hypothetical protein
VSDPFKDASAHHVTDVELPPQRAALQRHVHERLLDGLFPTFAFQDSSDFIARPLHARHLASNTPCHNLSKGTFSGHAHTLTQTHSGLAGAYSSQMPVTKWTICLGKEKIITLGLPMGQFKHLLKNAFVKELDRRLYFAIHSMNPHNHTT